MSYIRYDENGVKYSIKTITYNHHEILKNGHSFEVCETYEEAQHFIDSLTI